MQAGTRPFSRLFSRLWYKSRLFWLLALVIAYTLIGFLLIPYLVKSSTHDAIKDKFGWEGGPAEVSFNPYEIALRMSDFTVTDKTGEKVLGFTELLIDFDAGSIFHWAWTLEPSHLNEAYGLLEIDESGETNFGKALASHAAPPTNEPEQQESAAEDDGGLPRIWLQDISLNGGALEIRDHTQGKLIEHDISPVNLDLSDFRTHESKNGRLKIAMTIGKSQKIDWEGSVDSEPYHSEGRITLSNIDIAGMWPYVRPYVNYEIGAGKLTADTRYTFTLEQKAEQAFRLQLADGSLEVSEIEAAIPKTKAFSTTNLGTIGAFGAEGINYDFGAATAGVSRVYLQNLQLDLIRNKKGQINAAWPYTDMPSRSGSGSETGNSSAVSAQQAEPFKWQVDLIDIADSSVKWNDQTLTKPAKISVKSLAVTLKNLSQDLAKATAFTATMRPQDSGTIKLNGTLVPASGKLKSSVKVNKLSIPLAQPYVNEAVLMALNSGTFSTDGQLQLTADDSIGSYKGVINIDKFDATDPLVEEELVGWESLAVEALNLRFQPLKVDIESISLKKPFGQFIIAQNGETNFSALLKSDDKARAGKTPSDKSADGSKGKPPPITIGRIEIEDGRLHFEDNTLQPFFVLPMEQLSGSVTQLSSEQRSRSDVDLKGTIGDLGRVAIKGAANPLAEDLFVDIGIDVQNFSMTTISPYAAKYIGSTVKKGKLKLKLNYLVENGQLTASNDIVLEQFKLGESVKSEEAIDLPVGLAIALLKDANGTINISLPVTGNLNSPEFSIGAIVWEAFRNVIIKAATAPFSLIGNLIGGDSTDLESISFKPGSSALSAEAAASLETLVKALKERPGLTLEVQGISAPSLDRPILRQSRLAKRIEKQRKAGLGVLTGYEAYLRSRDVEPPARTQAAADGSRTKLEDPDYLQLLYMAAIETVTISDKSLRKLALSRSQAVNQKLVTEMGLNADQIFLLDVELKDSAGSKGEVMMPFELGSR